MKKTIVKKTEKLDVNEYKLFLKSITSDILQTQLHVAQSVAQELTHLYWRVGRALSEKIAAEKWGAKVIEKFAQDLEKIFPGIVGFSRTNIYRMIAFYEAYLNCPTAVGQLKNNPIFMIPWGHSVVLLEKLDSNDQRMWYAEKTLQNGWSRASLIMWIESDLYGRQGKAITNFKHTLVAPNSDLAQQTLKDPYVFDFLTLDEKAREREIEDGLIAHVQRFLLELGQGFSFVGRQYHLQVGTKDFYIDLLFYHFSLRCFVVIELKANEFDVRDVGQINLYLSAVDTQLKHPDDQPTIGLLLCKTKDNVVAEYALRDFNKPIGISSYTVKLVESLPKSFKGKLPSIAELEEELGGVQVKPEKKAKKVVKKAVKKVVKKSK